MQALCNATWTTGVNLANLIKDSAEDCTSMASLTHGRAEGIYGITVIQVACCTVSTVDCPLKLGPFKSLS